MRVRIASALAFAFALFGCSLLGCEGVPDLRFGDGDDGGAAVTTDATLTTSPGQPTPTPGEDATTPASDDAASDDASSSTPPPSDDAGTPIPQDASTPPPPKNDAAPPDTGCPGSPPAGAVCCGAVACKGNQQECNCGACAYCASEGYCCPSTHPAPGYCATSIKDCH